MDRHVVVTRNKFLFDISKIIDNLNRLAGLPDGSGYVNHTDIYGSTGDERAYLVDVARGIEEKFF